MWARGESPLTPPHAARRVERIRTFEAKNDHEIMHRFRNSGRTSSLGLEVRKDIVWEFEDGRPVGPKLASARKVARVVADAVRTYFSFDLPEREKAIPDPLFS